MNERLAEALAHAETLAAKEICAICGQRSRSRRLAQDHNHGNGRLRERLCLHCNTGLGHFRDDPMLLRKAADYLERHGFEARPVEVKASENSMTANRYPRPSRVEAALVTWQLSPERWLGPLDD